MAERIDSQGALRKWWRWEILIDGAQMQVPLGKGDLDASFPKSLIDLLVEFTRYQ